MEGVRGGGRANPSLRRAERRLWHEAGGSGGRGRGGKGGQGEKGGLKGRVGHQAGGLETGCVLEEWQGEWLWRGQGRAGRCGVGLGEGNQAIGHVSGAGVRRGGEGSREASPGYI